MTVDKRGKLIDDVRKLVTELVAPSLGPSDMWSKVPFVHL